MTAFPQYAKTTNPDVIAAVARNVEGVSAFHASACAFAEAHGAEKGGYYPSAFAGMHRIRAIAAGTKPTTGRWKRGYAGYGWLPFKNDPLHDEFEAIRFDEESLPGLPDMLRGPYLPNGQHMLYTPQPFLWGDAVYVGFSGAPVEDGTKQPDVADGGWVEILASEYHAAREAFNAAAAEKRAA